MVWCRSGVCPIAFAWRPLWKRIHRVLASTRSRGPSQLLGSTKCGARDCAGGVLLFSAAQVSIEFCGSFGGRAGPVRGSPWRVSVDEGTDPACVDRVTRVVPLLEACVVQGEPV